MIRVFLFSVVIVLSLAMGMGPVTAAENDTIENATDTENATAAANETINESANEIQTGPGFEEPVDDDVTVAEWSYDIEEKRFTIVLDVDSRTEVAVTEVVSVDEPQATRMNVFQDSLSSGTHEIEIAASPGASGEAAVVISTRTSMERGQATVISTGFVPQELPFEQTTSTAGWIGGALTAISMVAAAAYRTRNREYDPVVVCE